MHSYTGKSYINPPTFDLQAHSDIFRHFEHLFRYDTRRSDC